MIDSVLRYSHTVAQSLSHFFNTDKWWEIDVHNVVRLSASITAQCDAQISIINLENTTTPQFSAALVSAIPRSPDTGNIVTVSRRFFRLLAARGRSDDLVRMTNYLFKSLAISFRSEDVLLVDRVSRICAELHYWANVELHRLHSQKTEYRIAASELTAALMVAIPDKLPDPVAITMLTENYFDSLELWLRLYGRFDAEGGNLLILAIGAGFASRLTRWLNDRGFHRAVVVPFLHSRPLAVCGNGLSLDFLWYTKIHLAHHILNLGRSIVYSDLDAYWIQNYFDVRSSVMSATSPDVTLSITYDMPRSGVLQYGFVPCAGFFGAEPTPAGKALIADWLRMTEVMFDDQIALTEILLRQNAVWEITEVRHVGATTTLSTENGEKARVTMLDPHTARRSGRSDLAGVGEAVIWHPRWIDDPEVHKLVIARLAEMDTSETPTPRRA